MGFQHVVLNISWKIEGWTLYSVLERSCALSHIDLWVVRDYRTFVIGVFCSFFCFVLHQILKPSVKYHFSDIGE